VASGESVPKPSSITAMLTDRAGSASSPSTAVPSPSATTPTTAFALGEHTADPLSMYLSDVCTVPASLAGHPAISVPFGDDGAGLPVGVQAMTPALGEPMLFAVAGALERAAKADR